MAGRLQFIANYEDKNISNNSNIRGDNVDTNNGYSNSHLQQESSGKIINAEHNIEANKNRFKKEFQSEGNKIQDRTNDGIKAMKELIGKDENK